MDRRLHRQGKTTVVHHRRLTDPKRRAGRRFTSVGHRLTNSQPQTPRHRSSSLNPQTQFTMSQSQFPTAESPESNDPFSSSSSPIPHPLASSSLARHGSAAAAAVVKPRARSPLALSPGARWYSWSGVGRRLRAPPPSWIGQTT